MCQRVAKLQALEASLTRLQRACDGEHPVQECGILAALSDTDIA
ncbi:MAG: hypothetical protein CMP08_08535 [Xanthomonadales bacterium]|nr:hypothetical protein [Xanthomonadales bacterium]